MESERPLAFVSDYELLRRLGELVFHSRRVEADLVAHIGEVEARRLYAREASPSMFAYCRERLHLSEAEAYMRITVARAAREHGVLLEMLRDGRLHLSGIVRLLPVLTRENREVVLARATHCSKRQILQLVAELAPRSDAPTLMRKLPERRTAQVAAQQTRSGLVAPASSAVTSVTQGLVGRPALEPVPLGSGPAPAAPAHGMAHTGLPRLDDAAAPALPDALAPELCPDRAPERLSQRAVVEPLSPARYKVQFTASDALRDKLERLQALMRSEVPDGDLAAIIERAVSEKLERLEARRYAKTSAPRKGLSNSDTSPSSRHIPAAVRRAVFEREGGRCGYVDEQGRRCSEQARLEFHHRHPFGMGGDHSSGNVGLLCKAHNLLLAEVDYGRTGRPTRPRANVSDSREVAREQQPPQPDQCH